MLSVLLPVCFVRRFGMEANKSGDKMQHSTQYQRKREAIISLYCIIRRIIYKNFKIEMRNVWTDVAYTSHAQLPGGEQH